MSGGERRARGHSQKSESQAHSRLQEDFTPNGGVSSPEMVETGTTFASGTDAGHAVFGGEAGCDGEDGRPHVDVLVAVEMSGPDAGGENALDLGVEFAFDGVEGDAVGDHAGIEGFRIAEKFAGGIDQIAEKRGVRERAALGEIQMDADGERGMGARGGNGFVKGGGIGEQGGAGDDAGRVGFDDGAVDARGYAEIVGVDDELLHGSEAATGADCLFSWETRGDATPLLRCSLTDTPGKVRLERHT